MPPVMRRHFPRLVGPTLVAGTLIATMATPAYAWDVITSSANGNQSVTLWSFSASLPISDWLEIGGKFRLTPDSSSLLGPITLPAGSATVPPVIGFLDGELRAQANLDVSEWLPLGNLHPIIVPYAGVRGIGLPEGPLLPTPNLTSFNHLIGLTYGGQIQMNLPLQLKMGAYVGGTTFVSGGWSRQVDGTWSSGSIDTAGTTVPVYGFNLVWGLAEWLSIYAGYEWTQLPTSIRGQVDKLSTDKAQIGTLRAGLTFPFLSL